MGDMEQIRRKFRALAPVMDERMTRLWAAAEAVAHGRGGIALVTKATGIRGKRIQAGKRELEELASHPPKEPPQFQHIRRPGAGRKPLELTDTGLVEALDRLIDPVTRGDPESPLRWTCKSTSKLAEELTAMGHPVSATKVRGLLTELGYSLQANRKTKEGAHHPERDAQFQYINRRAKMFIAQGKPVISVDTKKKELVGDFKNGGIEWQPKGDPLPVRVHDFQDKKLGKAIPYGVYDLFRNEGWVSVGVSHDTAEFAVETIRKWWNQMGREVYPEATDLMVTADGGGSNGARVRLWKVELQRFAEEEGLRVHVSHFPPGTSKWNKIEHRMFSHITKNWRGRPLESLETVVNLIGATTTKGGLRVRAKLDTRHYEKGLKVTNEEMAQIRLRRSKARGAWNYCLEPGKSENSDHLFTRGP
jgi:hypothetical protein